MDKLKELEEQLDALDSTQVMVNAVLQAKKDLDRIEKKKLTDAERLWLLAFDQSEVLLVKMGQEDSDSSKEAVATAMTTLYRSI